MIDSPSQPMKDRLSPIRCGRCNWPVAHLNKAIPGAEAGGLCTRCNKDETGKQLRVFTYVAIVEAHQ